MKKFFIVVLLAACVSQVKAQQLQLTKPTDSLTAKLLDKYFKSKPGNLWQLQPGAGLNKTLSAVTTAKQLVVFAPVDHMPIAVLPGNDKMPIAKLGGYDPMPIAGSDPAQKNQQVVVGKTP